MKKVVGIVINVILWLFVVFAALTTVVVFTGTSNNGVGNLFGYAILNPDTVYGANY